MIRRAFTMRLKPGGLADYQRHHDSIWPELVAEFERQGIARITIFEDDPVLFLYSEITDEDAWDRLWHTGIHEQWAQIMNKLMVYKDDGIVDSHIVREIFHVETEATDQAHG
jgi:L-rhamnose mutarotase